MMSPVRFSLIAALVGCLANAPVRAQPVSLPKAVIVGQDVYLPGSPQMVAPAQAMQVILHPKGRYALVAQNTVSSPPGAVMGKSLSGTALLLYDARTGKTRTVWEQKAEGIYPFAIVDTVKWLPGTDCALATVRVRPGKTPTMTDYPPLTGSLLFFDFAKGTTTQTTISHGNQVQMSVSPKKPLALLKIFPDKVREPYQYRIVTASGTLSPPFPSPGGVRWNQNGTGVHLAVRDSQTLPVRYFEWNGETANEVPRARLPAASPSAPETPPLPLQLVIGKPVMIPSRSSDGAAETLHPLYLETISSKTNATHSSLLIAPNVDLPFNEADTDEFLILPDKSAILYKSQSVLYAVPLVHLSKTAFVDIQNRALRQNMMYNTRVIGRALESFRDAHKGAFPQPSQLQEVVRSYLYIKDEELVAGVNQFVYFYPGRLSLHAKNPADTVVGYRAAPGGKAVLYADNRVRWKDSK